jgi:hypothetical protein
VAPSGGTGLPSEEREIYYAILPKTENLLNTGGVNPGWNTDVGRVPIISPPGLRVTPTPCVIVDDNVSTLVLEPLTDVDRLVAIKRMGDARWMIVVTDGI